MAMADVLDVMLIDEIRLVTECEIEPVLAGEGGCGSCHHPHLWENGGSNT